MKALQNRHLNCSYPQGIRLKSSIICIWTEWLLIWVKIMMNNRFVTAASNVSKSHGCLPHGILSTLWVAVLTDLFYFCHILQSVNGWPFPTWTVTLAGNGQIWSLVQPFYQIPVILSFSRGFDLLFINNVGIAEILVSRSDGLRGDHLCIYSPYLV